MQQGESYSVAVSHANQTVWHETLSQYLPLIPPAILQNFISPNKNAMIILVSFSRAPGSFGSADSDPILKNIVIMRNIISQLKASDSEPDRKSTRLNSSHSQISYAVFCLKKKKK